MWPLAVRPPACASKRPQRHAQATRRAAPTALDVLHAERARELHLRVMRLKAELDAATKAYEHALAMPDAGWAGHGARVNESAMRDI
jgi:hypothetical protein